MRIIIIGGLAAGLKAAAKARRCNPRAEITVIEKGELISYGACGLAHYIAGEVKDLDDLMRTPVGVLRNQVFFQHTKDICVLSRTLATNINRQQQTVQVTELTEGASYKIHYDKLIIATGATPIIPRVPGIELENIFQLRQPSQARMVRGGLETGRYKNAVIIGADLIGLEMAEALRSWGLKVSVVEENKQILPAIFDSEIAGLLEKYLIEKGVYLHTDEQLIRFQGDTAVQAVETNLQLIPADLVLISRGVRPNAELAKAAGLELGITGAIKVDQTLRTSDPNIFAGGDCVENTHLVTGCPVFFPMGSTANKHGRIIGENVCGGSTRFPGILSTCIAKIFSYSIGKTGITEEEAGQLGYSYICAVVSGSDKPHFIKGAKLVTVKLIAEQETGKILGAQVIGEGEVSKRLDVVATLLSFGGTIDNLFDADLAYSPPYSAPIDTVAVAANVLMNKAQGRFKGISALEAAGKLKSPETTFLDVRTPAEVKQSLISKTANIKYIPLGQLRNRIGELNKEAEYIVICKIGLRAYEAALTLEGEGFQNVKVLEGGLAAWPF